MVYGAQMVGLVRTLSRISVLTNIELETLKTVAIFCGIGLLLSLGFMVYGLDLSLGFF